VSGVAALGGLAHTVAFYRLDENNRGLAGRFHRPLVGGINLLRVLSTPLDLPELHIGEGVHHAFQVRVAVYPVLPLGVPGHNGVTLVITIDTLLHAMAQHAVDILGQQAVPAAAPDDLGHVPVCAAKAALEFLDDLAITPHRAVETLQVAVHYQHEVVEFFPRRNIDCAKHFRFVGFTIADKTPDLAAVAGLETTVLKVSGEAGLVNRRRGRQAHGGIGHLPEVRHGPGVGVGAEPPAHRPLAAKILQP